MNNVDPDILFALRSIASSENAQRLPNIKARYEKRLQQHFETQMQLLMDEVERVVPRNHPLFELVLIVAVARKIELKEQEPEFISDIEAGWPQGW